MFSLEDPLNKCFIADFREMSLYKNTCVWRLRRKVYIYTIYSLIKTSPWKSQMKSLLGSIACGVHISNQILNL